MSRLEENFNRTRERRIYIIYILFFFVMLLLSSRLFFINVIKHKEFYNEASSQWYKRVVLNYHRGRVLDRKSIPFTNQIYNDKLLIFPQSIDDKEKAKQLLLKVSADYERKKQDTITNEEEIEAILTNTEPREIILYNTSEVDTIVNQGWAINYRSLDYEKTEAAKYIIGESIIKDGELIGISGIEQSYNQYLQAKKTSHINVYKDARQKLITSRLPKLYEARPSQIGSDITTTLDYHLQNFIENAMEEEGIREASAIVIENESGNILAMASPREQNENFSITKSYEIKSLYTMLIGALMLQQNPYYNIQAIANIDINSQQYNELMMSIDKKEFVSMIRKIGLGSLINVDGLELQEKGDIGDYKNIKATPLHLANVCLAIGNGGKIMQMNLISAVGKMGRNSGAAGGTVLYPKTAQELKKIFLQSNIVGENDDFDGWINTLVEINDKEYIIILHVKQQEAALRIYKDILKELEKI